ncbi:MAG: hypothetical protein JEY79_11620 [Pseudodesulfovibrio sp.]|nr:hypothetical protein [Pseudodesulfovibrio sp.]
MAMRKSSFGKEKQLGVIQHFVAGTTGRCAAELVGVNIQYELNNEDLILGCSNGHVSGCGTWNVIKKMIHLPCC